MPPSSKDSGESLSSSGPETHEQLRKSAEERIQCFESGSDGRVPKAAPLCIERTTGAAVYRASSGQARMFFLHEVAEGSPLYSTVIPFMLAGPLDYPLLEGALHSLVQRHDALRTLFKMEGDDILQIVQPDVSFSVEFTDFTVFSSESRETELDRKMNAAIDESFDLSKGPLFRVLLGKMDEDAHVIIFLVHHIIIDGWTMNCLYEELSEYYNARLKGHLFSPPEVPVQMPDYTMWFEKQLETGAYDEQFRFWKETLKDAPPPLDLKPDFPCRGYVSLSGNTCVEEIDSDLVDRLNALARQYRTTLFTVIAAAFNTLIHWRSGETDLLVGVPVANRLQPEVESVMGCLINTIVLRSDLSGNPGFNELLEQVHERLLDAYSFQEMPFERVVERLEFKRAPGRTPLFQVLLNFQEFGIPKLNLDGIQCTSRPYYHQYAKFDLSLVVTRLPGGWRASFEYRTELFKESTIRGMLADWIRLLEDICESPESPINRLSGQAMYTLSAPGPEAPPNGEAPGEDSNWSAFPKAMETPSEVHSDKSNGKSLLKMVLESCGDLLGIESPQPEDNFFAIGGHSLSAMRLTSRLQKQLGREVSLKLIFRNPVLGDFCTALQDLLNSGVDESAYEEEVDGFSKQEVSKGKGVDLEGEGLGLHQLVQHQASLTPELTCIVCDDAMLTFEEVNVRSNRLAHFLSGEGIGPGSIVGIHMDRTPEMILSMLGILKAGGAWLALDPDYPEARLLHMLEDSGAQVVLVDQTFPEIFKESKTSVFVFEELEKDIRDFPFSNPEWAGSEEHPAYLMYTSGSTGKPKGTPNPHRAIVNYIRWLSDQFPVDTMDSVLLKTPASFDISIWEVFLPLVTGSRMVLAPSGSHKDAQALIKQVVRHGITTLQFVPVMLEFFADHPDVSKCTTLRRVFCAGEALPVRTCRKVKAVLNVELVNLYGPSEAAIATTYYVFRPETAGPICPIGKPIDNVLTYVLDENFNEVPEGQEGELFLSGVCVGNGYLNLPDLTRERFPKNPFDSDSKFRMYRTGDRVRELPDGNLEFIGRMDDQVSLNGYRVELGELESVAREYPGIGQCAACVREDVNKDRQLVLYYTAETVDAVSKSDLRRHIGERLPVYMIPSRFVRLETLPLTPSGKVDRRSLPDPNIVEDTICEKERESSDEGSLEHRIRDVFSSVLEQKDLSVSDNFFEKGGHSLAALRAIARIRTLTDQTIRVADFFNNPTASGLAEWLEADASGDPGELKETLKVSSAEGEKVHQQSDLPMQARSSGEIFAPMSFAQQRLWFIDKFQGASPEYNIYSTFRLRGELNADALQKSFQALIDRHESLRTCFVDNGGEPLQRIIESLAFNLERMDLSAKDRATAEADARSAIADFQSAPFDLSQTPLIRVLLIRLSGDDHLLVINLHHIISDGWSSGVFNEELSAIYSALSSGSPPALEPLSLQYRDYAEWQRKRLSGEKLNTYRHFWRKRLRGFSMLSMPTDFPRPQRQSFHGGWISVELPKHLNERFELFNRENRVTPFMTFLSAISAVLSRYSGQEDIVIGTPVANRAQAELENVIGFFVNSLPLRCDLSGNPSFQSLVERVREVALEAFEHQEFPFEKIVESVNPERDLGRHPIFQVVVAVHNNPIQELTLKNLECAPYARPGTTTHFDLEWHFQQREGLWIGTIVYNTDLFREDTIQRFQRHVFNFLEDALPDATKRVVSVAILGPDERQHLLIDQNRTESAYPRDKTIHTLFREMAQRYPDAIAIEERDKSLTYRDLDRWSDQIGLELIEQGVSRGDNVGAFLDRSAGLVAAFLGILKAGAVYVPLAREYPPDRLAYMIADAGLRTIITDDQWPDDLLRDSINLISCRDYLAQSRDFSGTVPAIERQPTDPAYVIYTSGSTGRPKGSIIPHRGVVRLVKAQSYADFSPQGRFLLLASPSFDAATFEIWGPLLNGGTLAIYQDRFVDPAILLEVLLKHRVSCLWLTAGLFNLIVDTAPGILKSVAHILTGGEALSPSHVAKAFTVNPDLRLTNGYGPTECTTFACTNELEPADATRGSVPIGRPIAHTTTYILDEQMNPVPIGVAGELYIGGDGLSDGYLNQPELTRERFVDNPFSDDPHSRLYRTGDICLFLPDGKIDFLGRRDNQVKIRGFRVEMGEVEAAIMGHPDIRQAVVRAFRDASGLVNLVAYLVAEPGKDIPGQGGFKAFLSTKLPVYEIPGNFVVIEKLPLTPNGKVDLEALPDPGNRPPLDEPDDSKRDDTDLESELIRLWERLFQRKGILRTDNFFHLGGHSLLAARLASELQKHFNRSIPIAMLFECPTVKALAERLAGTDKKGARSSLVTLQGEGDKVPVFCIHGWGGEIFGFLDLAKQFAPERPVYGLQAVGLDGSEPRHETVEEMAAHYAREIVEKFPEGPYHLIGYSAGGWIAYAVAQELNQAGRQVHLAMLDTSMSCKIPYWLYAPSKLIHILARMPYHFGHWMRLPGKGKLTYIAGRFRWLRINVTRSMGESPADFPQETELKHPESLETRNTRNRAMDYYIVVAGNYRPKPFPGNLTLFVAKGSPWYTRIFWKFMIRGKTSFHFVDGGHHGIIDEFHVGDFSKLYKTVLDQLETEPAAQQPPVD